MEKQSFMQACREGAAKMDSALCAIYRDYRDALLRDGYAALGDRELACDLVQDTLIKAWLACASFRGESELFPWLRRIFRHNMIDMLRRRHVEVPLAPPNEHAEADAEVEAALRAWRGPVDATPEQSLDSRQSEACFRACAVRFAKDHPLAATVIRWVAEDGLGHDEIAELLQRSPGATREYVSQCRKKARVYFAEWYAMTLRGGVASARSAASAGVDKPSTLPGAPAPSAAGHPF